jgi:hypothetical protein
MSLKLALERLGLGPCYHMREMFKQLDEHVAIWDRAADGGPVDWDTLFKGYRSAVDFPTAAFYRELADYYREAKVILTVREPDRWYQSFKETIIHPFAGDLPDNLGPWQKMLRKAIVARIFGGEVFDREQVIANYERHNDEVKRTIRPEHLLTYEVSQGWEPLCRFLGVSAPDEPFPKVNTTDEYKMRIATVFNRDAQRQHS